MANTWTTFFNALVDICEEYNKAKEKATANRMETEFFSDIFAEPVLDKSNVVDAMIAKGWSSFDMKLVLGDINTPEQAKTAIKLINGGYSWLNIRNILSDM